MTLVTSFTEQCIAFAGPVWERYQHHPWIEALFAGTLSEERFRYWLVQDLSYLGQPVVELIFPKVPPHNPFIEIQRSYSREAYANKVEHKALALGDEGDFAYSRWAARPSRDALVNFWIRTAYDGSFGDMCAAMYVCFAFADTFGARYERERPDNLPDLHREWIGQFVGAFEERFRKAAEDGINEYGANGTEYQREQMRWIFLRATQLQIGTFDAAWNLSDPWPGEGVERGILAGAP
ncbi:MAG: hypothetical protein EXQ69_09570 [Acidimicrobiia bacterium]|nr:hypothetical protein [Acidimicrobiia bacterium]